MKRYSITFLLLALLALPSVFARTQAKLSPRQDKFLQDVISWAKSSDLNSSYEDGSVKIFSDTECYTVSFLSDSDEKDPYWVRLTRISKFDDKITKKAFDEEHFASIQLNTPFKANDDDDIYVLYIDAAYESSQAFVNILPYYIGYMENVVSQLSGESAESLELQRLVSDMVRVDGGSFTMGVSGNGVGNGVSNAPAHKVVLSPYMISKFEVTQALWEAVMNNNPSQIKGADRPVENVSWTEVNEFINKLNKLSGLNFRLPTEAEWEFAAKGGSLGKGYAYPGGNECSAVAWYQDNALEETHSVGKRTPNELGLYDMGGNVSEWCSDWLGEFTDRTETNPKGPASGSHKVYKGGDWLSGSDACEPSRRRGASVGSKSGSRGFRLAMDVTSSQEAKPSPKGQSGAVTETENGEAQSGASIATYENIQVKPTFKGGNISKFAQWVEGMVGEDFGYSGNVTVGFTVTAYGKVADVVVIKGGSKKVNDKVRNVVRSSPNWTPGKNNNKVVPVRCRVSLDFSK